MCAERQALILEEAAKTVRPGGVLVYSTCTFSPEENEGAVSEFLRTHEEYSIEETGLERIFSPGRADWISQPAAGIEHTLRLWPHLIRGEGHYIARLQKRQSAAKELRECAERAHAAEKRQESAGKACAEKWADVRQNVWQTVGDKKLCKLMQEFLQGGLGIGDAWMARHPGQVFRFGEQIYLMPEEMISLEGLKVLRPGLQLAVEKKNRFEPAHALALTLLPGDDGRMCGLSEQEAAAYLRGESLACGDERGWTALAYGRHALGFGKASGGQMKNHYPKGLRKFL